MSFFTRNRPAAKSDDGQVELVDLLLQETTEERERIIARAVRSGEIHAQEANEIVRTVARLEGAVTGRSTKARVAA